MNFVLRQGADGSGYVEAAMDYRKIDSSEVDALWDLQKQYKAEIGEDEPGEDGKERHERLGGHELFQPMMVLHPLEQVAFQFGVEERHRKFHEFQEEIGQQGNVDA